MDISSFTSPYRCSLLVKAYKGWFTRQDRVLDLGCGNGLISLAIKKTYDVDINCADIKNHLLYDLPFKLIKSGKKLPFADKKFDVVMLNDVLHHIPFGDQFFLVSESLRIANKLLIFEARPTLVGKGFDIILNKLHYKSLDTPLSFREIKQWILFLNR